MLVRSPAERVKAGVLVRDGAPHVQRFRA